jgi:hypothetical protein
MKYANIIINQNMNLLASVLVLSLIGMIPVFAEEMYPNFDVSEVDVNVNEFQETNNVIVSLLFNEGDVWFTEVDRSYTLRFGLIIDYENLNGEKTYINMNNTTFEPLGNVEINKFYDGGDKFEDHQVLGFTFSNLNEIFPQGTTSQSVSFELSSPEIKFGMTKDDVYNAQVVKYGIESDYTTFNLNDSKQIESETTQDSIPAPMEMPSSTEEQMKLQQQQAIEQAEQRKAQRDLEKQKEMEFQAEQERIKAELESQQEQKRPAEEEQTMPEMIPEPTVNPIPEPMKMPVDVQEAKEIMECGAGTILVDGHCQIIQAEPVTEQPVKEQKGFFEWLMSLFGM